MMARKIPIKDLMIVLTTVCVTALIRTMYYMHFHKSTSEVAELHEKIVQYRQTIQSMRDNVSINANAPTSKDVKDTVYERKIPPSRILDRSYQADIAAFQRQVTVLIYSDAERSGCLVYQVQVTRKMFPVIQIIVASQKAVTLPHGLNAQLISASDSVTEGKALNKMLSTVRTENFLYLSEGAVVSGFTSDNGPGWLLHSLASIPELHFVGGGYVRYNASLRYVQFEAQCYRMKMCHWVFSQTYEYKYSVGDMMVCEDISTSFMGRTAAVAMVGPFDDTLTAMTTTEFFWRAKQTATVGLRPEVFFHVSKACVVAKPDKSTEALQKQAFMYKYDVRRVIDSYGRVTNYPTQPREGLTTVKVWPKFTYKTDGGMMTPASYEGLVHLLVLVDDFFKSHPELVYFMDSGVPLGGIKMRSILWWDGAADIDTGYYGIKWQDLLEKLKAVCHGCSISTGRNSFGPEGLRQIALLRPNTDGAFDELYTHEFEAPPLPDTMLYILINGKDVPLPRNFLEVNRQLYGVTYLQHSPHKTRDKVICKVPGHHACVPAEFQEGAGHWKDFYCR